MHGVIDQPRDVIVDRERGAHEDIMMPHTVSVKVRRAPQASLIQAIGRMRREVRP